jgi:hypothetical protein
MSDSSEETVMSRVDVVAIKSHVEVSADDQSREHSMMFRVPEGNALDRLTATGAAR